MEKCKCLICTCGNKFHTAKDRRKRYLKEVALGRFSGTWNEYQTKCKQERLANLI